LLLRYGCVLVGSEGSHFKVENPDNGNRATVPVHGGRDLDKSFFKALLVQLGIDLGEFLKFIS